MTIRMRSEAATAVTALKTADLAERRERAML